MSRFNNRVFVKRRNVGKSRSVVNNVVNSVDLPEKEKTCDMISSASNNGNVGSSSSTSRKKLNSYTENYSEFMKETNEIINIDILSEIFQNHVNCKHCGGGIIFSVKKHVRLACEMVLVCENCNHEVSFYNCRSVQVGESEKSKLYKFTY